MDINVKIIEAIKQQRLLYAAKGTLKERQFAWKQLAEELKMQEQFLRSRWYMLLEGLKRAQQSQKGQQQQQQQQSIKFKYKHEMDFLRPYLQQSQSKKIAKIDEYLPEHIVRPEFVITEKDLENYGQNDEEYVFLEVEPLEVSGADDTDKDNSEVLANETQEETAAEVKQKHEIEEQQTTKCDAVVDASNQKAVINASAETIKQQKPTATNNKQAIPKKNEVETTIDVQEQKEDANVEAAIPVEDTDKNDADCKSAKAAENIEKESNTNDHSNQSTATKNSTAKSNSVSLKNSNSTANNNGVNNSSNKDINSDTNNTNSANTTITATNATTNNNNDRSEEDIFGELVAAMLKRMPAEKKRLVKKDIMNLLLT